MKAVEEVRFVATNFFNLQGLRMLPLGLLMMLVNLWANVQRGPARDLRLPLSAAAVTLLLIFAIDRYYRRAFGRVERTAGARRLEWAVSIIGGILVLGAFFVDTQLKLPLSAVGLVFAVALLADYVRINWLAHARGFLLYYPLGAMLMAVVSLLPLLGFPDWWQAFGIKHQLLAIGTVIGLYIIIAGLWGHIFLVRTLPARMGPDEQQPL